MERLRGYFQFSAKKVRLSIGDYENLRTFATAKRKQPLIALGYGVMVTLQILVLSFLVRVQVAQQGSPLKHCFGGFVFLKNKSYICRVLEVPLQKH